MKICIFSDIHGSVEAALFITSLVREQQPDTILFLGDVLYHGPRNPLPNEYLPGKVCEILNPLAPRVIALRGNCDSAVDETLLAFPLAPRFSWLMVDNMKIFATHGHEFRPDALPPLERGSVFLYGHTHVPQAEIIDGISLCNPGSLALPKKGLPKSYAVLENREFRVMTCTGEVYMSLAIPTLASLE